MAWRRALLVAVAVSLAVTAALAVGVLLFGSFDERAWRVLGTTGLVAAAGLLTLPAGVLFDLGIRRTLAGALVAAALGGGALLLAALWGADADPVVRTGLTLAIVAGALAQLAAQSTRGREGGATALVRIRTAAALAAVALAATLVAGVWAEPDSEAFARAIGVLAVLDAFLLLLQPVVRRLGPGGTAAFLLVVDGEEVRVRGRDRAGAVAAAVREAERGGRRVRRIELP